MYVSTGSSGSAGGSIWLDSGLDPTVGWRNVSGFVADSSVMLLTESRPLFVVGDRPSVVYGTSIVGGHGGRTRGGGISNTEALSAPPIRSIMMTI